MEKKKPVMILNATARGEMSRELFIQNVMGLLPSFFSFDNDIPLYVQCTESYPFYVSDMEGGKYNPETRAYSYPGDPDLKPLIVIVRDNDELLVYPHSIVAGYFTRNGEKVFRISRMD